MPLAIETGAPLPGANTFVDGAYLIAYYADVGVTIEPTEADALLIKAFRFMTPLPWKVSHATEFVVTDSMKKAQCELAYAYSQGFDSESFKDYRHLVKEGLGRGALVDEYEIDSDLKEDRLKLVPKAYDLLKGLLGNQSDNIGFMLQR